jgi:branched-chain amino acid transport system ATP-binding protein
MSTATTGTTAAPDRIAAHGVTVRFGGLIALKDVDLAVAPHTIAGLVGPNGAGKSTLFAVLSGLLKPAQGTVSMNGVDVTHRSPQKRASAGLARTFQHPELFSSMTVREHVVLAHRVRHARSRLWTDLVTGRGLRRPPAAETERVDDLIEALHLEDIAHRPATGLPLGKARLVEVARALAVDPTVLLLDEPSSGLDVRETEELVSTLTEVVRERGVSLLIVEHDVELVISMSDVVHVLDFGVKIAEGAPSLIRDDPAVRAAYLGEDIELAEPRRTEQTVAVAGGDNTREERV